MKCTDCGKQLKPVVVFDIDGTLSDYHETFTSFCEDYFGFDMPHGWDGTGNFENYLRLTRPQYREAKLAYRQGGNKRWAPMYPGSRQMVIEAVRSGSEVWIATTRPWQRLDNIDPDTREWLARNSLNVDGLLFGEDKYHRLLKAIDRERIAACVEDLAEQFDQASMLGLPVIQIERRHNRAPGVRRMPRGNIDVVRDWVQHRIDQWKDNNEQGDSKQSADDAGGSLYGHEPGPVHGVVGSHGDICPEELKVRRSVAPVRDGRPEPSYPLQGSTGRTGR